MAGCASFGTAFSGMLARILVGGTADVEAVTPLLISGRCPCADEGADAIEGACAAVVCGVNNDIIKPPRQDVPEHSKADTPATVPHREGALKILRWACDQQDEGTW